VLLVLLQQLGHGLVPGLFRLRQLAKLPLLLVGPRGFPARLVLRTPSVWTSGSDLRTPRHDRLGQLNVSSPRLNRFLSTLHPESCDDSEAAQDEDGTDHRVHPQRDQTERLGQTRV